MNENPSNSRQYSDEELADLVASTDSGSRSPAGAVGKFLAIVALVWSVYQVILASPLSLRILPSDMITNSRQIHLAFAIFLAYCAYPAFKSSPRDKIPVIDWIFAVLAVFTALYGYIFYEKIVDNGGLAQGMDQWWALLGLVLLFEASRRALGPAMAAIATIFLLYVFFGSASWVPEVIRWKGASIQKAMSHMWITTEGVFGIALGVSTSFVFLFVLFGALLDKAGAGNYFIKMAFGALGHLRGGPAKAAVIGSAATGLISGSSISNVVTTGTFTIPLMKRVGFSSEKAGAVEVGSSVNGQIMPPVMGAAAFLMVEYVGISYFEVVKAAALPAVISYIGLIYIVHLEAVKKNMPTLSKPDGGSTNILYTILGMVGFFVGFAVMCYATQFIVAPIVAFTGGALTTILLMALVIGVYIALLRLAASKPDLEPDDPNSEDVNLPDVKQIYQTGLYYLLPIVVLVYFLMIERKSPGLSAFWATALMIVILLTQRPLKAMFRGQSDKGQAFKLGVVDLLDGMITGARNMIGIALATAAAGVIVGTVTLTGIGQVMAALVEFLSGGNLILMLLLVGILSLILGMGLPTTANYIVVSSLMAGVVVELGAQSGLIVPLIAVHLFVFYFGIMADVTPPVGLASFAAAAVSGGDAIKTGAIAFFYSLRTIILPFMFIFNTQLLLLDVGYAQAIIVFVVATVALLLFTAGTMGWFLTKSNILESIALCLIAFALLRPGFFVNQFQPPFEDLDPARFETAIGEMETGSTIRLRVAGPDFVTGDVFEKTIVYTASEGDAAARLDELGLAASTQGDAVILEEPFPGKILFNELSDMFFYDDTPVELTALRTSADQIAKEWIWIPAFLLLGVVVMLQRGRIRRQGGDQPSGVQA